MYLCKKEKIIAIIGVIAGAVLYLGLIVAVIFFMFSDTGLYSQYETEDILEYGNYEGYVEMKSEELFPSVVF